MGQLQLNSFYRISFNYVVGSHTIEDSSSSSDGWMDGRTDTREDKDWIIYKSAKCPAPCDTDWTCEPFFRGTFRQCNCSTNHKTRRRRMGRKTLPNRWRYDEKYQITDRYERDDDNNIIKTYSAPGAAAAASMMRLIMMERPGEEKKFSGHPRCTLWTWQETEDLPMFFRATDDDVDDNLDIFICHDNDALMVMIGGVTVELHRRSIGGSLVWWERGRAPVG